MAAADRLRQARRLLQREDLRDWWIGYAIAYQQQLPPRTTDSLCRTRNSRARPRSWRADCPFLNHFRGPRVNHSTLHSSALRRHLDLVATRRSSG